MIVQWRGTLGGFDATQHLAGMHQVSVEGDCATCVSHFRAEHRIGDRVWELDGDWTHELERGGDLGWRITAQRMVWTFERGDRALMQEAAERGAQWAESQG